MGRILGLDYGSKRVGVAVSDPDGKFAFPIETFERKSERKDASYFQSLIDDYRIERIVIGLPVRGHGGEDFIAREAREWGKWLAEQTGLSLNFFDERYTSVQAEEILREQGLKASERKAKRDMIAAQLLLQDFLNAGAPEQDQSPGSLDY